jgi:hypothetical protein
MFVWLLAGFLEASAGALVGALGYTTWHVAPAIGGDNAEMFVHGASSFCYFLVATPRGWLALWLFGEGLMRVLAGAMQQPFSTLPVVIARGLWSLRPAKTLPEDTVAERDDGFVIDSAREYDWHALTTVELDGALYAVAREDGSSDARPHRYRLTPITPEHVVRTKTRYR